VSGENRFQRIKPGDHFGRWTVLERSELPRAKRGVRWDCVCDCGTRRAVNSCALLRKQPGSCGCRRRELAQARLTKHGLSRTPEYRAWCNVRDRCENPRSVSYPYYGARGVTVCERWQDFENFLADMGPRPSSAYSIERDDPFGNYEPGNCSWATIEAQARNKRRILSLVYNGQRLGLKDVTRMTGISYHTLRRRLELGWTDEQTVETPAILGSNQSLREDGPIYSSNVRIVEYRGQTMPLPDAAALAGLSLDTVSTRLTRGWTVSEALGRPARKISQAWRRRR
jgi:hypothetical protein